MKIFTSTFSAGMISQAARKAGAVISIKEIPLELAQKLAQPGEAEPAVSAVGHPATAALMSRLLGVEIPFQRVALSLSKSDKTILVVFQLDQSLFKRLNEGEVLDEAALDAANEAGALSWLEISFM